MVMGAHFPFHTPQSVSAFRKSLSPPSELFSYDLIQQESLLPTCFSLALVGWLFVCFLFKFTLCYVY